MIECLATDAERVPMTGESGLRLQIAISPYGITNATRAACPSRGVSYTVATYNYSDTAYGFSTEDHDGFVKVLAAPDTKGILGTHIIGTDASILIQEVANAMRLQLPFDAITQSIYVNPALPEVVQRAFGQLQSK